MKQKRLISMFISVSMTLSLCGCDSELWQSVKEGLADSFNIDLSSDDEPAIEVEHYDYAIVENKIEEMKDAWSSSGQETAMSDGIQFLLDEFDTVCEKYLHLEMEYYADWNNEEKEAIYDAAYTDYCIVDEMVAWAFTNGYHKSAYPDLFENYSDEDNASYYMTYSLSKIKASAKRNSQDTGDSLDDYYDIAYKSDHVDETSVDDSNLTCAKLYLDTLKDYNLDNYLYDYYLRDYDAEEVSAMYDSIVENLVPLYRQCYDALVDNSTFQDMEVLDLVIDENPFETILRYAPRISPSVKESAEKLWNESLYLLGSGDASYEGGYTVNFPTTQTAEIYLYTAGDYYDLLSAIHEFGHFHSDWNDQTPLYLQKNCIDVAEIQSQGMQMLFMQFYDDIYGDNANLMWNVSMLDLLDSVISGFAIGEFEYRVMKDYDDLNADQVAKMFADMSEECDLDRELYEISHLYEQPGYYISYGVSALAALQIYAKMQESPEEAYAMYDRISAIPTQSGEYTLCKTLGECGFADIFEEQTIEDMTLMISNGISVNE